jgi:hypothetical protein
MGGTGVFVGVGLNVIVEVGGMDVFVAGAGEHDPKSRASIVVAAKKWMNLGFMFVP